MNESDLIKLAAKAAGLWDAENDCVDVPWAPLHRDGDAFRLAMTMKMDIARGFRAGSPAMVAYVGHLFQAIPFPKEEEVPAAARRAITELAAKIQQATEAAEEAANKAMP